MSIISREIYHQKLNEYSKLFSVVTIKDVDKPKKDASEGMPIKIVKRQFEIGGIKKNGIVRFYNHPKEFSLEFNFVEIKRTGQPEKYSQKLFLPLTYSLEHILDIVNKVVSKSTANLKVGDNVVTLYTSALPSSAYRIGLYDSNNNLVGITDFNKK